MIFINLADPCGHQPGDEAVGVDAGQAKHEDGCDDEDEVKTGQANQKTVDGAFHLRPEICCSTNATTQKYWKKLGLSCAKLRTRKTGCSEQG